MIAGAARLAELPGGSGDDAAAGSPQSSRGTAGAVHPRGSPAVIPLLSARSAASPVRRPAGPAGPAGPAIPAGPAVPVGRAGPFVQVGAGPAGPAIPVPAGPASPASLASSGVRAVTASAGIRAPASPIGRPAGGVVLTRRGRAVATGFLAVVAAAVLFLVLPRGADASGAGVPAGRPEQNLSQVTVHPGDTLWSIAVRADPSADPRLVMQRITGLNALAGTGITPGQTLWVPRN